ncbi:Aldo/keto reductase [Gloeophyllum trabeum ATCC 11539]|uniref:Aldo/keto reductase n=1 Tax=Gloeophyllum trabeum (strain ATCC 11539 / FP-39264 / Madison 617) TaxID=670483 RepID=S7RMA5_GLOTA|nr:Aldo/keto reductase [Gloeophyllum trabeum ATCC 11539]EPQ55540.1 Aldo/keto reductase [Gloeophyllum trabeum ATCC 11539]
MVRHNECLETFQLGPLIAPRIWTGLWQLSSNAWGTAPASKIRREMARHAELGYVAFADHYGSAEILFGQFQQAFALSTKVIGATKWCVFRPTDPSRQVVEAAVRERMKRMNTKRIDLLQFHWQDYSNHEYMTALRHLQDLQREGLICAIGLCNFDSIRSDEICTQLGPGSIMSNQVQFSLIDTRPLHGMAAVCEKHCMKLLTYGTLCGGFLADHWLHQPEPDLYSGNLTPSQRKYLDIIVRAWGSWALFQELLTVLRVIADRHRRSIANIATRWVLDHSFVGAVLVGSRLGVSEHTRDNQKAFGFKLSPDDNAAIEAVLERSNGRRMITSIGDCGAEYR